MVTTTSRDVRDIDDENQSPSGSSPKRPKNWTLFENISVGSFQDSVKVSRLLDGYQESFMFLMLKN
jgi:hypothetical protein